MHIFGGRGITRHIIATDRTDTVLVLCNLVSFTDLGLRCITFCWIKLIAPRVFSYVSTMSSSLPLYFSRKPFPCPFCISISLVKADAYNWVFWQVHIAITPVSWFSCFFLDFLGRVWDKQPIKLTQTYTNPMCYGLGLSPIS